MKQRKVVITGVTGFIGRHLIECLAESQYEYVGLSRHCNSIDKRHFVQYDMLNENIRLSCINDGDIVVHLAAVAHRSNTCDFSVNVSSSKILMQEAIARGASKFIFMSSIGVNGDNSPPRGFTATDIANPQDMYSKSKHDAETELLELANRSNIQLIIIRAPLIYGFDAPGNFALFQKLADLPIPMPFGSMKEPRSFLYIRNLIDFILHSAYSEKVTAGVYLLADAGVINTCDFFSEIAFNKNKKIGTFKFPVNLLKAAFFFINRKKMITKMSNSLAISEFWESSATGWSACFSTKEGIKDMFSIQDLEE